MTCLICLWQFLLCFACLWITDAGVLDLFRLLRVSRATRWCGGGAVLAFTCAFQMMAIKHMAAMTFATAQSLRLLVELALGTICASGGSSVEPQRATAADTISARKGRLSIMIMLGVVILYHDAPLEGGVVDSVSDGAVFSARSTRIGFLALIGMVTLDGFARVYLERTKAREAALVLAVCGSSPPPNRSPATTASLSVLERNFVLSWWGLMAALVLVCVTEWPLVRNTFLSVPMMADSGVDLMRAHPRAHLLYGMSTSSAYLVLLQSAGSLLVSSVCRRVSDHLHSIASVATICAVCILSVLFFSLRCSAESLCGAAVVCVALWSWSDEATTTRDEEEQASKYARGDSRTSETELDTDALSSDDDSPLEAVEEDELSIFALRRDEFETSDETDHFTRAVTQTRPAHSPALQV